MSSRSLCQIASCLPACGFVGFDSAVPVLDSLHLGVSPSLKGPSWPGFTALVLASFSIDPFLSLQSFVQFGPSILPFGCGRLGATTFVPDHSSLDALMILQGTSCLGLVLLIFGKVNSESPLLVLDSLHLGAFPLLRSFSQTGSSVSVPDSHLDVPLLLRSFFYPGPSPLMFGRATFGLMMPVLDLAASEALFPVRSMSHLGPTFLLMSLGCPGLLVSMLDFAHFGSSVFVRSFLQLEPPASFIGNCDFDGAVPVLDYSMLDAFMPARQLGRSGSIPSLFGVCSMEPPFLALDYSLLDFSLMPHSSSHSAAAISMCSAVRPNSPPFVPDPVHPGAIASWQRIFGISSQVFLLQSDQLLRFLQEALRKPMLRPRPFLHFAWDPSLR